MDALRQKNVEMLGKMDSNSNILIHFKILNFLTIREAAAPSTYCGGGRVIAFFVSGGSSPYEKIQDTPLVLIEEFYCSQFRQVQLKDII